MQTVKEVCIMVYCTCKLYFYRKDFNVMNKKFLKVCDGVNLIMAPCQYKGFNLKPGMLLFDADTEGRVVTGFSEPFVAMGEDDVRRYESQRLSNAYGYSNTDLGLVGYTLTGDMAKYKSICFNSKTDNYNKIANVVDLALGSNKLHDLFLSDENNRYNESLKFSVYDPESGFNSFYNHVIGNVFLQKIGDAYRDKLTLLSKSQVEAYNKLSPYGIVEYGESNAKLLKNTDEIDKQGFHDFLLAFYNAKYDGLYSSYSKDDVKVVLTDLKKNIDISDKDTMKSVQGVHVSYSEFVTDDGFNMKPFMIRMTPDFVKKHMYEVEDRVVTYGYDKASCVVDDGIHNVYLTSIRGYDHDYDDYPDSEGVIYNCFYFDGYDFTMGTFALKDNEPFALKESMYRLAYEAVRLRDHMEDIDNYEDLEGNIVTRLEKLENMLDEDEEFSEDDYILIESVYRDYLRKIREHMSNPVTYEVLTDEELHPTQNSRDDDSYELEPYPVFGDPDDVSF